MPRSRLLWAFRLRMKKTMWVVVRAAHVDPIHDGFVNFQPNSKLTLSFSKNLRPAQQGAKILTSTEALLIAGSRRLKL